MLTNPYKNRPNISLRTRTATFKLPTARAPGYCAAYGHLPAIANPSPVKLTINMTVKNRLGDRVDEYSIDLWCKDSIPVTVVPDNPEDPQGCPLLCWFGGWRRLRHIGGDDRCILLQRLHGEHIDVRCFFVALSEIGDLRRADIQCPFLRIVVS